MADLPRNPTRRSPRRRSSPPSTPTWEMWVEARLALRLYLARLLQGIIQRLQWLEQRLDPRSTTDPDVLERAETVFKRIVVVLMEWWKAGLGSIRGWLPMVWQRRLSDRILTSVVIGILALTPVLGGQLIGWLGSQPSNQTNPSTNPSTTSITSPSATAPEVPDAAPGVPDAAPALPSPPPATASPVSPPLTASDVAPNMVSDSKAPASDTHAPTIAPPPPTSLDTDQASDVPAELPTTEVPDASPAPPSQTADANSMLVGEGIPPEPSLLSRIQTQLTKAIAPYGQTLLLAQTPDYAHSRLTVQLSPDWYALEPSQQDALALSLRQQAEELQFTTIELVNPMGGVVARSPVVGDGMVVFQRHQ